MARAHWHEIWTQRTKHPEKIQLELVSDGITCGTHWPSLSYLLKTSSYQESPAWFLVYNYGHDCFWCIFPALQLPVYERQYCGVQLTNNRATGECEFGSSRLCVLWRMCSAWRMHWNAICADIFKPPPLWPKCHCRRLRLSSVGPFYSPLCLFTQYLTHSVFF